jgi:hypothetical protein
MAGNTEQDRIDNVAPGDLITLERDGAPARQYKVVHKSSGESDSGTVFTVVLEGDDGQTFDLELTSGSEVIRSLESKWESPQSPTAHAD